MAGWLLAQDLPGVGQEAFEPSCGARWGALSRGRFGTEVRICPVSGLSTLQGACPFAKPKAKAKDGGKKEKARAALGSSR